MRGAEDRELKKYYNGGGGRNKKIARTWSVNYKN